jgi:predicted membrane channel-forming protein YqfA (hemolysin III family)
LCCSVEGMLSPIVKVDGLHTVQCCYYVVFCCTFQGLACIGCFFSYLSDKRRPDALVSFCYAAVCVARLLNLPDTLLTTKR